MIRRLFYSTALALVPFVAQAADLPARKAPASPVMASAFNWTGFYVGGQLGWAGSKLSVSGENEGPGFKGAQNLNSFLAGGFAGYDHQVGSLVLGVEADANARVGDKTGVAPWLGGSAEGWKSESAWDASLRLRLGMLVTNQTLVYATGGLAIANFKIRLNDAEGLLTEDKIRTGWTIGAGVQHALTKNISLRGEYRYSDYGSKSGQYYDGGKGGNSVEPFKSKAKDHRATLGLAYKF